SRSNPSALPFCPILTSRLILTLGHTRECLRNLSVLGVSVRTSPSCGTCDSKPRGRPSNPGLSVADLKVSMQRVIRSAVLMLIVPGALRAQSPLSPDADPRIQQLVASVSEQRLRELDTTLASFGTRETMSTTTSLTRGIGAARQWIFDELKRS